MKSRLSAGFGLALALTLSTAATATDFALDRTLRLDPGDKFSVDSDVGGIVLVGDTESDARIRITAARDLNERYDIRFDQDAGNAKLTIERKGGWLGQVFGGGWSGSKARIEVHVPRSTSVDLRTSGGGIDISQLRGTAYLRTSGGGIDVLDVEGSVDASTSGGAVNVEQVRGEVVAESSGGGIFADGVDGSMRADTSGGGVELVKVSGEIYAQSSGGGVRVRDAGGRVEASSSGGPVKVSFAAGNGQGGDLSSSGGGVHVEVDPQVGLSVDASSSGGGVDCDLPVTVQGKIRRDALRGNLNGGGAPLRLESSGGGVHIGAAR